MFTFVRALQHRSFALLWSGQTISQLGNHLHRVALAWWVLETTGSALVMGTVVILQTVPQLLFLLVGGALVDRYSRQQLLLLSDLVRGVVVALMAVLAWDGALAVWHVCAISLVFGLVDAFFPSAQRALLPELVPAEVLPNANSLTSLSGELSGILGPALAALIVAAGGSAAAFGLDALSFFISALCLWPLLKLAGPPQHEPSSAGMLGDVRAGLATVLASPWLWITIGVAGLSNLTYAGPMEVGLPFLVKDHLHADVGALGLFYSASSLGAVLAAFWLGRLPILRHRGLMLYGAWLCIGLLVALLGLPIGVPVFLAAGFGMGLCNVILSLAWTHSLQELVPHELLGRVSSIDYLGSYALIPVGSALGGWAIEQLGVAPVFVAGGLLQSGLIALGLLHPQVRRLD